MRRLDYGRGATPAGQTGERVRVRSAFLRRGRFASRNTAGPENQRDSGDLFVFIANERNSLFDLRLGAGLRNQAQQSPWLIILLAAERRIQQIRGDGNLSGVAQRQDSSEVFLGLLG